MSDNSFVSSLKKRDSSPFQTAEETESAVRDLHLSQRQLLKIEQQRLEAETLRLEEERRFRQELKQRAERHCDIRRRLASLELEVKTFADDLSLAPMLEKKVDNIPFAALRFAVIQNRFASLTPLRSELDDLADIRFFGEVEYSIERLAALHPDALCTAAVLAAEEQLSNLAQWPSQSVLVDGEKLRPFILYSESRAFVEKRAQSLTETFRQITCIDALLEAKMAVAYHLAQTELASRASEKLWQRIEPVLRDLAASRLGEAEIEFVSGHAPPSLHSQRQNLSELFTLLRSIRTFLEQAETTWHEDKARVQEAMTLLDAERFGEAEKTVAPTFSRYWQDIQLELFTIRLENALEGILKNVSTLSKGRPERELPLLDDCIAKFSDSESICTGLSLRRNTLEKKINARSRTRRKRLLVYLLLLTLGALVKVGSIYVDHFDAFFVRNEDDTSYVPSKKEAERMESSTSPVSPKPEEPANPQTPPPASTAPAFAATASSQPAASAHPATAAETPEAATEPPPSPQLTQAVATNDDQLQPVRTSVPEPTGPEQQLADKAAFDSGFKRIAAGAFQMGEAADPAVPTRTVTLGEFHIATTEVSLGEWKAVKAWAEAAGYSFEHQGSAKGNNHPVTDVSWFDAVKWCNARSERAGLQPCYYTSASRDPSTVYRKGILPLRDGIIDLTAGGYRLPTETEWEKAARGGVPGRKFPNGHVLSTREANFANTGGNTMPVKYYIPNPYGLLEMAGNVSEWCEDTLSVSPQTDALSTPDKIVRGGGWTDQKPDACGVAFRTGSPPESTSKARGFRLLRRIPKS
jgi:formylglycine-generating enzyme required for sulfatase activity